MAAVSRRIRFGLRTYDCAVMVFPLGPSVACSSRCGVDFGWGISLTAIQAQNAADVSRY